MALAVSYSRAHIGMSAPLVTIEVHISGGLPAFSIVGLAETAVREAKERVRSAILNSQFDFPTGRITVNMAPADLPKQGGQFDLAIAMGILVASDQIKSEELQHYEWLGELSLAGNLREGPGALPAAMACKSAGRKLVCSRANASEAALVNELSVQAADHLLQACKQLHEPRFELPRASANQLATQATYPDMADVKGQFAARRALEIAAAGRHNLLFFGPPGTGKTLLASRLPGLLPKLSEQESLEVAAVQSISNQALTWSQRPFRTPHHTASAVALIGGGSIPKPGEVTLAHCGVLFLDELAEFPRHVLDVLREPLESHKVTVSRAARRCDFPAKFQLVAAMNPSPGGYAATDPRSQRYTPEQIQRYLTRVSGPFLDRIDLHIEVSNLPKEVLQSTELGESTEQMRPRIEAAWQTQIARQGVANSELSGQALETFCALNNAEKTLLNSAIDKLGLSARAYHRILKVARTVADLRESPAIDRAAVVEALHCRQLEKLIGRG